MELLATMPDAVPETSEQHRLTADLVSIYEEIMWLSRRPNVTPGRARSWYTHVMAEAVKRRLRRFTGQVSRAAATAAAEPLTLEHFKRLQTTLSNLVQRHRQSGIEDPSEFLELVQEYEQVHIVTRSENYAAMRAGGDYARAGIVLLPWSELPAVRQEVLWRSMLQGRVANAAEFRPRHGAGG